MRNNESYKNDLKIWYHFIKAQSKLIDRLCTPIPLLPISNNITAKGSIKVEINQTVNSRKILTLIKEHFTKIKNEDIFLERGYFLLANDAVPDKQKLDKFTLTAEKQYLEFNPYPTIEGTLINLDSPIKKLEHYLNRNGKPIEFKEGKMLLTLKELELFDQQNLIQRTENIGAVYPVSFNRDKLKISAIEELLGKFNISKEKFNIVSYENKIYAIEAIFTNESFRAIHQLIGLSMQTCVTKFYVTQDKFMGNWEQSDLKEELRVDEKDKTYYEFNTQNNVLNFDGEKLTHAEFIALVKHSLLSYYGKDGIEKVEKQYIFDYIPNSHFFEEINDIELEDTTWNKIKEQLDPSIFWCNLMKDTISFDFDSLEDFAAKYGQINKIKGVEISDFKERHKFKVTPIINRAFESVKKELSKKIDKVKFKEDADGQKLLVRYSYQLSDKEEEIKLKFLNTLNKYKTKGFDFVLDEQFKVKFIIEENEALRKFEEDVKFNKIRGAEVKYKEEIIGNLRKANFPIIELQLKPELINKYRDLLSGNERVLDKIEPILTGEVEKILRLKDTVNKLQTNGNFLPNPNIVNFIFDSSKAKKGSTFLSLGKLNPQWMEVFRTKLSTNINDSQLQAVLKTLNAEDLAIIQGPPGTGKSTAISEIIWQHLRKKQKQKILLTSETHLAVDNAIDKLTTTNNNIVKSIRYGNENNLEEEGARFSLQRLKKWEEEGDLETINTNNGVVYWIKNIAAKSKATEEYEQIKPLIDVWNKFLDKPDKKVRSNFLNNYLDYVNVLGATCSSIAKFSSPKTIIPEEGEKFTIKPWTSFFRAYLNTFHRDLYNDGNNSRRDCNDEDIEFDIVIMDEASKATPPEFSLPLLYGKKSIVVGDHRQLPPMLDENDFATTLEMIGERKLAKEFSKQDHNVSHFEKLFLNPNIPPSIKASFDTQYRMHPQINEVIKQFYIEDNGLKCGLSLDQVDDPNLNNPVSRYHGLNNDSFIDPETHVIWVDVNEPEILDGTSRVNFGEVEACKNVLKYLTNARGFSEFQNYWSEPEDKEIGLISFYGKQLHYLQEVAEEFEDIVPIRTRTVDRFQGMERNIIIVSMVRSNKIAGAKDQEPDFETYPNLGYAKQQGLGFAEFPNRLNVALSRAKRLLIIVGNATHFCKHKVYRNVYETIQQSKFDKVIDAKTLNKYPVNTIDQ